MSAQPKLLYILPDLAYIADLIPTKKAHTFALQNFLQINGEFVTEEELLVDNLKKLIKKLDEGEYTLVLPDFLFTNTIVNIKEKNEDDVKAYIKSTLLPELDLSTKTHQIETFILTQHKEVFKVQLSALEKSLIAPLKKIIGDKKISISSIVPLSWTIKSVVSLEPSISIIQMGDRLYLSQHYIGLDQTLSVESDKATDLVETVKTLKGAEPSIQTIYLLSSSLVEEKIKESLSKTLPVQQLSNAKDNTDKVPPYVKQAIEAGMTTLSIKDYLIPHFELDKAGEAEPTPMDKEKKPKSIETTMPTPKVIGGVQPKVIDDEADDDDKDTEKPEDKEDAGQEEESDSEKEKEKEVDMEGKGSDSKVKDKEKKEEEEEKTSGEEKDEKEKDGSSESDEGSGFTKAKLEEVEKDVDLGQFVENENKEDEVMPDKKDEQPKTKLHKKNVVKDKPGVNGMLKMIFIGLVSFFITVGVGVGLGLGVLSLTKKQADVVVSETPTEEVSVTPAEETPTPTPEPEIVRSEFDILVVNATTKAGYAGEIAAKLKDEKYASVTAGNAKGDYEEGLYLLMTEENVQLLQAIANDSGLELTFDPGAEVEDSDGSYDAVLVLAE